MRRLVLQMSMSLDGFVAGPGGASDWQLRGRSDDGRRWVEGMLRQAGLHALGRRAFEQMAAFWPTVPDPQAAPMNSVPKAVFTRQAGLDLGGHAGNWAEAEVMTGDLATAIGRLKARPGGEILAHGGADFAQDLVATGLVDEYRLIVHPVALGQGLRLFDRLAKPLELELATTTLFRTGAVARVYRPAA